MSTRAGRGLIGITCGVMLVSMVAACAASAGAGAASGTPRPADSSLPPFDGKPSSVPGTGDTSSIDAPIPDGMYISCGDALTDLRSAPGLTVDAELPPSHRSDGEFFSGTITITSGGPTMTGVTSTTADMYLARSGRVMTVGITKDAMAQTVAVSPGHPLQLPAAGATVGCAHDGSATPLEPGNYQVFAVVTVIKDDGSVVLVTGGPWPLELT